MVASRGGQRLGPCASGDHRLVARDNAGVGASPRAAARPRCRNPVTRARRETSRPAPARDGPAPPHQAPGSRHCAVRLDQHARTCSADPAPARAGAVRPHSVPSSACRCRAGCATTSPRPRNRRARGTRTARPGGGSASATPASSASLRWRSGASAISGASARAVAATFATVDPARTKRRSQGQQTRQIAPADRQRSKRIGEVTRDLLPQAGRRHRNDRTGLSSVPLP